MEEENEYISPRSAAIKFGAIAGIVGIISTITQDVLSMQQDTVFAIVGIIISVSLLFLAHKEYKDKGDGYMDYGQGVGIGFWYGLVSSTISSIFLFIYVKFVSPEFLEVIRDKQIMEMEEKGLTDAQIEQGMEMASTFSGPNAMLIMGIIFGTIMSVIIALIVSAITKNSRPEFE